MNKLWSLPEGVDALQPPMARKLEIMRRDLLDSMHRWGYELIMPPFVEYLSTLLAGAGSDYERETFSLVDQHGGRLLGLRPDMTPQAARFDAELGETSQPRRLCYSGSVLRSRLTDAGESRTPLQLGAEIFGAQSTAADIEIVRLMLQVLRQAGIQEVHLDLGHVGIFRRLVLLANIEENLETALFDALQRKSVPDLSELLASSSVAAGLQQAILALTQLNGGADVLERAREQFAGLDAEIDAALSDLQTIREQIHHVAVHIDLAELRGYRYQTGLVFAAYTPGHGREIARGGRYHLQGEQETRPGTGFSTDLRTLFRLGGDDTERAAKQSGIFAPYNNDQSLRSAIDQLRDSGERVVQALNDAMQASDCGCDRQLALLDGEWQVSRT